MVQFYTWYNLGFPSVNVYGILYHAIEKYSQSAFKKAVVYSTVLHPTFPSCAARVSHWLYWPLFFLWHDIQSTVIQRSLVVYQGISHFSLTFSWYRKDTCDSWDILSYTTGERGIIFINTEGVVTQSPEQDAREQGCKTLNAFCKQALSSKW